MIRVFFTLCLLLHTTASVCAEDGMEAIDLELMDDPFALPPEAAPSGPPAQALAPTQEPPDEGKAQPSATVATPIASSEKSVSEKPRPVQQLPLPAPTLSAPPVAIGPGMIDALPPVGQPRIAHGYQVVPNGNNLELVTPQGRRFLFGDTGLVNRKDYKIEIPLEALRPAQADPEASPPANSPAQPTEPPSLGTRVPQSLPPRVTVEHDFSDRLILEANRLYNRGKYYEATLAVDQALSKRPDLARAWIMKGSLLYVQGYRDLAKGAWEKAVELEPGNQEVLHYLRGLQ